MATAACVGPHARPARGSDACRVTLGYLSEAAMNGKTKEAPGPETTGQKQATESCRADHVTRFRPGESGNPSGRPKGARHKLSEAFLEDMLEAWSTHGKDVIARVIEQDPTVFLRSIVSILPKQVEVDINQYDNMTDDQLKQQFLAALKEANALGIDVDDGVVAGADQRERQKINHH